MDYDQIPFDDGSPPEPWEGDEVARFLKGDRWASFVDGFRVTEYAMENMEQHFIAVWYDGANVVCEPHESSSQTRFATGFRLDAIEQALGAEKYAAATAKVHAKWQRRFAVRKADQAKACKKCGAVDPCTKCRHQREGERH